MTKRLCRGLPSERNAIRRAACAFISALALVAPQAKADQKPDKPGITLTITGDRVDYFTDAATISARGNVRVVMSNGVMVTGDACSVAMSLRRFVVAGHVRLATPHGNYVGAAFADMLPFHRAYFISMEGTPDRWTFLGDDWANPEKGRTMPGDAFFLADMSGVKPFISAKSVVLDPQTYASFMLASFRLINGAITTVRLPIYVRNFSSNPNFAVNSLAGASIDVPYAVAGSPATLDAVHFRYDTVQKAYLSFEHHSVFGEYGYAVFSLNPATKPEKQWNALAYIPTSTRNSLVIDAQLFTYQYGLSQPLSSSAFGDAQFTQSLRESAPKLELAQAYDSLLAPTPLGYYGDPSHPFVPNHPFAAALEWPGFTQRIGHSGFSSRVISGAAQVHDGLGVAGTPLHDVGTIYVSGILDTPVVRAPLGTSLYGSYVAEHVWLSYPNSADFQSAQISDSKRLSQAFFVTGSWLLQSVVTKNLSQTVITPNTSTGMVPQTSSPNGFPLVAGVVTEFPHVTNSAFVITTAIAPSPSFQITVTAQENHYTPVQEPFVAGPPRYVASADARMKISRALFLDIGRAYYFNWANQRWSPNFSFQVSAQ